MSTAILEKPVVIEQDDQQDDDKHFCYLCLTCAAETWGRHTRFRALCGVMTAGVNQGPYYPNCEICVIAMNYHGRNPTSNITCGVCGHHFD